MFYVYMLASKPYGTLYVGTTSDLARRMWEHKNEVVPASRGAPPLAPSDGASCPNAVLAETGPAPAPISRGRRSRRRRCCALASPTDRPP